MISIKSKYFSSVLILLLLVFSLINCYSIVNATDNEEEGLRADRITTYFTEDSAAEVLAEGNALIIYDNIRIEADTISFNMETKDVVVNGNVYFKDVEYEFFTDSLKGNLDTNSFQASGDVRLNGDKMFITSTLLDYNYKEKMMIFDKKVSLEYGSIKSTSDKVIFKIEEDIALLEGNVDGQQNGYSFSGDKLQINTREEKIILSGKARLLFEDKGE